MPDGKLGALALMVGRPKPAAPEESPDGREGLRAAARDVRAAMQGEDDDALVDALEAFVSVCRGGYGDE